MPDIFDQVAGGTTSKGDIFDQIAPTKKPSPFRDVIEKAFNALYGMNLGQGEEALYGTPTGRAPSAPGKMGFFEKNVIPESPPVPLSEREASLLPAPSGAPSRPQESIRGGEPTPAMDILKAHGKNILSAADQVHAHTMDLMAGLGKIIEEAVPGYSGTWLKQKYQELARKDRELAEEFKTDPQGAADKLTKTVLQGVVSLGDPTLPLMANPAAFGAVSAIAAYGQGRPVDQSIIDGLKSGIVAKGFGKVHGLKPTEAAGKLGAIGATEAATGTPGGLEEKALAGLEGGVTQGIFGGMAASRLGPKGREAYKTNAPIVGHEKALEIARTVEAQKSPKGDIFDRVAGVSTELRTEKPTIKYTEGGDALGKEYHGYITAIDEATGKPAGRVDYSYWNGETAVKMIEVDPEYRRMGIATDLLKKLQADSKEPIKIQGNFATEEGQALWKKFAPEMPQDETGKTTMPPAPEKPQGGETVKAGGVENTVRGDIIPPVTSKQGPGEKTTEATPKPEGGEKVFYRGTTSGSTERIESPFAKDKLFVSSDKKLASAYGENIEIITAKPDAKILYEGTPEFKKVFGKKEVMGNLRKGELYPDGLQRAVNAAESAGYDAVHFSQQGNVGTVILNEKAFNRNQPFEQSRPSEKGGKTALSDIGEAPGQQTGRKIPPIITTGQKPGKSDYVPPQELAGAARAIDQARISQRTSPGTARLAQHLLTLDPTFDQNSTLEISDAVHKATPDIIKREGLDPEGEYAILGKTVSHIEDAATRTAISLYKGHDADTLVEEWYHRAYDRLNPKDRAAYDAYHKKTGDTRSPNEHFAQEGRDFFFSDKLHEAAGGIRRIFEGAREALKALIKRVRDLRGAKIPKKIQEMYRRAGQARKEARAPRKKPSKAYEEIAEGMPYYQARKINKDQADLDAGARDARRVADQQLGKKPQDIDKGFFEGITDLKPIRDLLHELGIKDKYDGITLTNKDYVDVYKYLQMPADVKISHPEFGPLYDRQRERELSKAILDHAFAKKTEPYFKGMDDADRIKVDAALIQGEQEGVSFYDPLQLKERFGLNERQIAGYTAIRDSLDAAGEMLLWEMEQSGVKPEALEEFKTRLAGYVPHKWYGNWAIIVRKKGGKKTKFMTKTNFLDRYTERDRVQALYPNDEVFVMQSKKIPYEAYQDAAPWAVSKMVDLVIDKAEVSPAMADELKQALGDLYKSKGFGAHFIKRKGTPGWTEDLAKPLAEYFAGLNGYMTKMRAIKGFAEDIQAIDPKKKPNLYRYALDYIRYVTGEPFEFAGAKQAAYIYYLYANIKSAAVNLTQNMLLGWPVLAKHTRLAGAKLLQAQARAANRHMLTDGEKAFLEEMESLGYLDPKMAVEMGAFTANPLLRQIPQGVKDFGEFIDIFQHMEAWNRRAMAVALYDSGIREPMRAAELIEEAHFRYSKGNRPELMRGIISPIMTFRSWMINYVTWLKNEIKAGRLAPVARSLAAMVLLGGFAGLPFFKLLKKLWVKVFGEDPQTAAAKHIGKSWATLIFRGLPSKLGISFTGSIGLGDILPTDLKSLGGVFADIPGRIARVIKDLSSRDYVRALEDASPEAIRQPMAAYRSATEGDTTRSGAPIFDPTTGEQQRLTAGEAATKSLGFQPMRSAERWDLQETVQQIQDARTARKQEWANRYVVAMRAGNKKEVARVVREINDYNKRMKAAGRPDDMITKAEVLSAIQSRKKAGVPPKYMRPKWKRLLEGRGMMPSQ